MKTMTAQEKAADLERRAPRLREQDLEEINGLFRAFLFRSAGGDVWTTCCRRHEKIMPNTAQTALNGVMRLPHTPEPRSRWDSTPETARRQQCPWCGHEVTVKDLRYCGQRKNLWEYRRAVVLRQWRGALWATAWDCEKSYTGKDRLTDEPWLTKPPTVRLMGVYRFAPNRAESATRTSWWADGALSVYTAQTAVGKSGRMWRIHAPYGYCADLGGKGYHVIGWGELEKGFLRYCGLEKVRVAPERQLELLTAACFYPRQIEWLVKLGLEEAVAILAARGVKHAEAVRWDAETPREFLGIAPKALSALRQQAGIWMLPALEIYRKLGQHASPADCGKLGYYLDDGAVRRQILTRMKKHGISVAKMASYLEAVREANKHASPARAYVDYLTAAEGCGLNLTNPVILMPRDFWRKHDGVTAAWSAIQANRRNTGNHAAYRKRIPELTEKYLYWDDEYLIRAPVMAGEITEEGKTLEHCVGGYAERHLSGQTTILFLRRRDRPHTPLATIEMWGNRLIQVHGYRNERVGCADNPESLAARALYKGILDPWLKWLEQGSPRDKQGRPKQKKEKRNHREDVA